jgi:aminoglycoside 3-N-acetyltransferase I
MATDAPWTLRQLGPQDLDTMHALLDTFGEAFEDPAHYAANRPDAPYLQRLLGSDGFIVLVAERAGRVLGGLAAYVLPKFEQARSEIYIYDLAVRADSRRLGIATGLIQHLKALAAERGAWVVFVQADTDPEDQAAIALYEKLGRREEVLHFDIPVEGGAARRG